MRDEVPTARLKIRESRSGHSQRERKAPTLAMKMVQAERPRTWMSNTERPKKNSSTVWGRYKTKNWRNPKQFPRLGLERWVNESFGFLMRSRDRHEFAIPVTK